MAVSYRVILINFSWQHLIAVGEILDQVFLIFPHFCFGRGLIDLAETYFTAKNFELIGKILSSKLSSIQRFKSL